MKSLGIIAEFNPFHSGHRYLIENALRMSEADVCISVMSGDFVQRGGPACSDKWERAKQAVNEGVNLVAELPVTFACNGAERFAAGGTEILEALGCDYIGFGSESGDIDGLVSAAHFLRDNDKALGEKIKALTREGISYPKAREKALYELSPEINSGLVSNPNNILALEYLKKTDKMIPVTVKRTGEGHHESASKIRESLRKEDPLKYEMMEKNYWNLASAAILKADSDYLENLISAGAGLGNRLKKEIRYSSSADELTERVKSKAYTYTRISRLITQALLGMEKGSDSGGPGYIRILAFDSKGASYLRKLKKEEKAALPVIVNTSRDLKSLNERPEIVINIQRDIMASDIYNIITGQDLYENSDYVKRPYIRQN